MAIMIQLSELKAVEDAFFRTKITYYKPSIYKLISRHFREENDFSEATFVKLKNLIKTNNVLAYNTILKKDIKHLEKSLKEFPRHFDEGLWRDMLPKIREEVKATLGMDFKTRSIFFEKSFPPGLLGFEKKGASSVTIFEGQEGAGIYFLNKRVSAFFTPILMIHEQLHSCLSQNKDKSQMYIEWFEEGLCQWYSLKIYHNLTKNMDVLNYYKERSYIYSKVKDEHNFTKRYYEYMKVFSKLYMHGGDRLIGQILLEYLSNNREGVNNYLDMKLPAKHLPKTEPDNYLVGFAEEFEPEKVPPVEYLILLAARQPLTIPELSKKVKVPEEFLKKVLIALSIKGMVILRDKVEINWRKKDLLEKSLIMPFWPLKS